MEVEQVYLKYARYRVRHEEMENKVQLVLNQDRSARREARERVEENEKQWRVVAIDRDRPEQVPVLWGMVLETVKERCPWTIGHAIEGVCDLVRLGAAEHKQMAKLRPSIQGTKSTNIKVNARVARLHWDIEKHMDTLKRLRTETVTNRSEMRAGCEAEVEVEQQNVTFLEWKWADLMRERGQVRKRNC